MVLVRKWYFRDKCQSIVRNERPPLSRQLTKYFTRGSVERRATFTNGTGAQSEKKFMRGPTAIGRRLPNAVSSPFASRPFYPGVNPELATGTSAKACENVPGTSQLVQPQNTLVSHTSSSPRDAVLPAVENDDPETLSRPEGSFRGSAQRLSTQAVFSSNVNSFTSSPRAMESRELEPSSLPPPPPRKPTGAGVDIYSTAREHRSSTVDNPSLPSPQRSRPRKRSTYLNTEFPRSDTILTYHNPRSGRVFSGALGNVAVDIEENSNRGVGNQDLGPIAISKKLLRLILPQSIRMKMERTFTIHVQERLVAKDRMESVAHLTGMTRAVRWLKNATLAVGRNSRFHTDALADDEVSRLSLWLLLFRS